MLQIIRLITVIELIIYVGTHPLFQIILVLVLELQPS